MEYDVIVVGGGMAGLTAAAFTAKAGRTVLLCEKESALGGLIGSFEKNGFTFDSGIRAIEDSGIVFPMLKSLGIKMDFVKSRVSLGIADKIIPIVEEGNLKDYYDLLAGCYPENEADIKKILKNIRTIMRHMKVLYGIENPLFKDLKKDREYLFKVLLPWLGKFIFTIGKINRMNAPVTNHLKKYTSNQALIDIISQHFFKETPAFFAMSYFSLYLDYSYPVGGTGMLPRKLEEFIVGNQANILKNTEIISIDHDRRTVRDAAGNTHAYKNLIWASDQKALYNCIDVDSITDEKIKRKALGREKELKEKIGGDSVFSLYLSVDLGPDYFAEISNGHFFYTPLKDGVGESIYTDLSRLLTIDQAGRSEESLTQIKTWIAKYIRNTTFEISIPVLKDKSLAPPGKTGLIISVLFDYALCKKLQDENSFEEMKKYIEDCIIDTVAGSVYPKIRNAILDRFSFTPLSIAKKVGSSDGAITGWAFTNKGVPAVNKMQKVALSILTPMPDIFQAGQWTYSPSGLPIAILTGKLAADKVISRQR